MTTLILPPSRTDCVTCTPLGIQLGLTTANNRGNDMLYLKSSDGGLRLVILESANLDELRKGRPAHTPDGSVLIAWTPDPVWLADKLMDCDGDAQAIAKVIDEASKRPEKPGPRPPHKTHVHKFGGDDQCSAG